MHRAGAAIVSFPLMRALEAVSGTVAGAHVRRAAAAAGLLAVAVASGACSPGSTAVASTDARSGRLACAPQLNDAGAVTFGLSKLVNRGDSPATLREFELVDPDPGLELVGAHLLGADDPPVLGTPYETPTEPVLTIDPGEAAFLAVGLALADGENSARADGVAFRFDEGGHDGEARTYVAMLTVTAGEICEAAS